jgi:AAA domain-containing protein/UvrD-like helicase family protein
MPLDEFPPTDEQQAAIDAFGTGAPVVIKAGAGTGKTTTLALCARSTRRPGTYLAFNKAIARDARRSMPLGVNSSTVHSIAGSIVSYRPGGRALMDRLNGPRQNGWQIARKLGVGPLVVRIKIADRVRDKVLQPGFLASHVMKAAQRFAASADDEPGVQHFPLIEALDPISDDGRRSVANNRQVARELLGHLQDAWADLTSPAGDLRFFHDVYLKLAQLERAEIPGQYILFDEAQDANAVILDWLAHQASAGKQIIYVGDSFQQIYDWRGAIDALDVIAATGAKTTYLTQSWRFGQDIADVANAILADLGSDFELVGNPNKTSRINLGPGSTRPRAILTRTNAAAVEAVFEVQRKGLTPHLVGGADDIVHFAHSAAKLQAGEKVMHPELVCFDTWAEVLDYVANDPQGDELRMMVNLLEEYGIQIVLDALDGCIAETEADVIISTAHKAKGRQWPKVLLTGDFDREDQVLPPAEQRLLYVAATRAQDMLDLARCAHLRGAVAEHRAVRAEIAAALEEGA